MPQGAPGGEQENAGEGAGDNAAADATAGAEAEPGFGDGADGTGDPGALPDMRDTPASAQSMESILAAMEAAMGENGTGSAAGSKSEPEGEGPVGNGGTGEGTGDNDMDGSGGGNRNGPLTPAEQIAILDARLESSAGDFDAMILEEQQQQRRTARSDSRAQPEDPLPASAGAAGGSGRDPYGDIADTTGAGGGGGTGSAGGPGRAAPANPAKYPPPADIPDGDGDDVVARQLREAAMREPDPVVREKLWDEYRRYRGIDP